MENRRAVHEGVGGGAAAVIAAASEALSAEHGAFEIVASSDVAMCVVDALANDQPVVFANRAFLALTGYDADEVVGRNCRFMQGADTDPRDVERFRFGLATERPFQISIVNHHKNGEPFRNEVFVSPVRDADGAIVRYIGLLVATNAPGAASDDAGLAALRHQFRNQIQTMTSLVGLLGQRLPPGEGRNAFEDLRARFEAITIVQTEDIAKGGPVDAGRALTLLAERVVQLYDPRRTRSVTVVGKPLQTSARRAALLAQILAEMLIDLFRLGLPGDASGATVRIEPTGAGEVRILVSHEGAAPEPASPSTGSTELGLAIVSSLTRSVGGSFTRRVEAGFSSETIIPDEV